MTAPTSIPSMKRHRRHYTKAEIAHILARHPHVSCRVIAEELGRTVKGVEQKVHLMALRRTAKQISKIYGSWSRRTRAPQGASLG